MTKVIISYDGTENDDDALALGKLLAGPDELALAYIRHAKELDPDREKLAQHDAEQRLELGAGLLERPDIPRHVVFGASTGAALEELADREGAAIVVFGSDYRTQPGHAEPPTSAQRLLEIGDTAVGVAASGLRAGPRQRDRHDRGRPERRRRHRGPLGRGAGGRPSERRWSRSTAPERT